MRIKLHGTKPDFADQVFLKGTFDIPDEQIMGCTILVYQDEFYVYQFQASSAVGPLTFVQVNSPFMIPSQGPTEPETQPKAERRFFGQRKAT